MAKYVDKEKAIYLVEAAPSKADALTALRQMSAADVVPVRRGRWMEIPEAEMFMCSECGEPGLSFDDVYIYDLKPANFCPNCGARMDGKDGEHAEGSV